LCLNYICSTIAAAISFRYFLKCSTTVVTFKDLTKFVVLNFYFKAAYETLKSGPVDHVTETGPQMDKAHTAFLSTEELCGPA